MRLYYIEINFALELIMFQNAKRKKKNHSLFFLYIFFSYYRIQIIIENIQFCISKQDRS